MKTRMQRIYSLALTDPFSSSPAIRLKDIVELAKQGIEEERARIRPLNEENFEAMGGTEDEYFSTDGKKIRWHRQKSKP